jgi:peptidoglycan/LPS O-acetylase OafA/YrhL
MGVGISCDVVGARPEEPMATELVPRVAGAQIERVSAVHIPSLDGIRAISFGLVFVGHAGLNRIVPAAFGVTVFFFLSGYLITTLLRLEWQKKNTISFRKFYLRRALRILPPFYLVFLMAFTAYRMGFLPTPTEQASMTAVVLHYSNYYIVAHDHQGFLTGTGVYWSLAVEEHFYLLFPWVFFLLATRLGTDGKKTALVLLAICAVVLAWRCVLVLGMGASTLRTSVATESRFDSLLFGCVLALFENPALDQTRFSQSTWKRVLLPLGVLGLLVAFVVRSETFRETVRYSLQGISLIPVFVCAVRYPTWFPMRFLNLRPIVFVGVLSYSLYLIHLLVLGVISRHLSSRIDTFTQGVVGLAISIALSWLIYMVVEKPCAQLRRRLHA